MRSYPYGFIFSVTTAHCQALKLRVNVNIMLHLGLTLSHNEEYTEITLVFCQTKVKLI